MSIVIHTPHIVKEGQQITPSVDVPFVIVTKDGQPVKLIAHQPWSGESPPAGVKTLAIIVIPEQSIDPDLLREQSEAALENASDAEGVALVKSNGEILGVLSTADILGGLEELPRGLNALGYEQLPSSEPYVRTSLVFTCPEPGCCSPDVTLYQKGQEVPSCPIHNIPRIPKQSEE